MSHPKNLKLGSNVDIGYGTYIQAEAGVEIGDDVQIGSHVSIYSVDTIDGRSGRVFIGQNARVGSFALILPGARIGSGEFVKAYQIRKGKE